MALTLEDLFARANDPTGLGSAWRIEQGNIQVLDEKAIQQAGVGFANSGRAVHLTALDTPHQKVAAWVSIAATSASAFVEVFARGKEDTVGSPFVTDNAYAVRLFRALQGETGGDTLTIQKLDSGVATELGSVSLTLGSPKDNLRPIQIVVEDRAGFVEIFGFIDDLDNHRLSVIDRSPPLWRQAGRVGFNTLESKIGTTPTVSVEHFAATVLDQEELEGPAKEAPIKWNFGAIFRHAQERTDQGSRSSITNQQMKDFLNFAEQQFVTEVGDVFWRLRPFQVVAQKGNRFMFLPRRVSEEINSIQDLTNGRFLSYIQPKELNIRTTNRTLDQGTPHRWTFAGMGSGDRIRLELFATPTQDITYEVWAKAIPGLMVDDEDFPLVPQRYAEALVLGGVIRAAMQSGNDKLLSWNQAQWNRILKGSISAGRRGKETFFHSGRSTPRTRPRPLTRRDAVRGRFSS